MADHIPGIESKWLAQRVIFLRSRVDEHLKAEVDGAMHQACAATLLRDAACIALLLGNVDQARPFLREAGHLLLRLGLAAGSPLIALAWTQNAGDEFADYADVLEGVRHQWSRGETQDGGKERRPMASIARSAPRQMLSLLQADWLAADTKPDRSEGRHAIVRAALERVGGYPAGETGLSIDSYARMAEWMTEHRGVPAEGVPNFIATGITTVALTRAEYIRAAMKDSYHWRKLARPAEILDLDSVVLMSVALRSGMAPHSLRTLLSADVALNDAPLRAALRLRNKFGPTLSPGGRRRHRER